MKVKELVDIAVNRWSFTGLINGIALPSAGKRNLDKTTRQDTGEEQREPLFAKTVRRNLKPQTEGSSIVQGNVDSISSITNDQPLKRKREFALSAANFSFRCRNVVSGRSIVPLSVEIEINTKTIGLSIMNDLPIGEGVVSGKGIGGRHWNEIRSLARNVGNNFGLLNGLKKEGLLSIT